MPLPVSCPSSPKFPKATVDKFYLGKSSIAYRLQVKKLGWVTFLGKIGLKQTKIKKKFEHEH